MITPSKIIKPGFQWGFSKNLEISRKGEWASPDPFSPKFSIVLKTPYKTLSFLAEWCLCGSLLEGSPTSFDQSRLPLTALLLEVVVPLCYELST
jgi:hypothetical protein